MTTQAWARMPLMHPVVKDAVETTVARIHPLLKAESKSYEIVVRSTSHADWTFSNRLAKNEAPHPYCYNLNFTDLKNTFQFNNRSLGDFQHLIIAGVITTGLKDHLETVGLEIDNLPPRVYPRAWIKEAESEVFYLPDGPKVYRFGPINTVRVVMMVDAPNREICAEAMPMALVVEGVPR